MKNLLFVVAMSAAVVVPSVAVAMDDAMSMAPMVCRAAKSDEKPNAMMGSSGMMCKKVDMAKVKAAMDKMHATMAKMEGGTADQKAAAKDLSGAMASFQTLYGFGGG
jgi:hypothetical protein